MQFNSNDSGSSLHSEINITPLDDVVLALLIIFMVVVQLVIEGYHVDIPRAAGRGGDPEGLSGDPGGSKDPCSRIARARGGDSGRPARGTARAVPGRRRSPELRGGSTHH